MRIVQKGFALIATLLTMSVLTSMIIVMLETLFLSSHILVVMRENNNQLNTVMEALEAIKEDVDSISSQGIIDPEVYNKLIMRHFLEKNKEFHGEWQSINVNVQSCIKKGAFIYHRQDWQLLLKNKDRNVLWLRLAGYKMPLELCLNPESTVSPSIVSIQWR